MKKFSKVLLVVLALTMLFAFSSCAKEADKYVGTWKGTIDYTDALNEYIMEDATEEDAEIMEYLKIKDYKFDFVFTFADDGTFTMEIDEASATEAFKSLKQQFKDGMTKYFEDMIAENNLNCTVDELLASQGVTIDQFADSAFDEKAMAAEMKEEFNGEGNFKAEEGKLWLSDGKEYDVDEKYYFTTEITDTTLKLTSYSEPDEFEDLLKITLTKQAAK